MSSSPSKHNQPQKQADDQVPHAMGFNESLPLSGGNDTIEHEHNVRNHVRSPLALELTATTKKMKTNNMSDGGDSLRETITDVRLKIDAKQPSDTCGDRNRGDSKLPPNLQIGRDDATEKSYTPSTPAALATTPITSNGSTTISSQAGWPSIATQPVTFSHTSQAQQQAMVTSNYASMIHQMVSSVPSTSLVAGLPYAYQTPTLPSVSAQSTYAPLPHDMTGLSMIAPQAPLAASYLQASLPPATQTARPGHAFLYSQPNPELPNAHFNRQCLPPMSSQNQSQLIQSLIQENIIKGEIIGFLLSQQQPVASNNIASSQQMAASANQMELLLRSMAATKPPASDSESTRQSMIREAAYCDQATQTTSYIDSPIIPNIPELVARGHLHSPNQLKDQRWMMRFEELKEFRQKHGHCRVPHGYTANRKLSWWVMNQRAQHQLLKQGKKSWLSRERVLLLDALQFDWKPILGKSCNK